MLIFLCVFLAKLGVLHKQYSLREYFPFNSVFSKVFILHVDSIRNSQYYYLVAGYCYLFETFHFLMVTKTTNSDLSQFFLTLAPQPLSDIICS